MTTVTRFTRSITTVTIPCGPRTTKSYIGHQEMEVHARGIRVEGAVAGVIGGGDARNGVFRGMDDFPAPTTTSLEWYR